MTGPAQPADARTADQLRAENADLRWRMEEAEETLRAIRTGAVDAVVVGGADGRRVYTLDGADKAYRMWVEQINQGAATLTADGAVAYCNPRLTALLGVPPTHLAARTLREFVRSADRPRYDALLAAGLTGSAQGEIALTRTDGTPVPVVLSLTALPAESGAAVGVLATDLTAQRHHEELAAAHAALQASEQRLTFALAAGRMGTWDLDLRTGVMTCSDACKQNYGRGPGEPFGYGELVASVHEDDVTGWRQVVADAVARAADFAVEYRTHWPDGSVRWVHVRASCQSDAGGQAIAMSGVSFDVTDRKQATDTLRASEERYRVLATATSDVVYRMSADWAEMFPLDGRGLIASNPEPIRDWLARNIPAVEHERVTAAVREAVATKSTFELEHQVIRPDGTLGWTLSRAAPILDAGGRIVEWFGTARDVTARKRAEEAVRASERRFRTLFDSMDQGFCVIEVTFDGGRAVDYRFTEMNPAFDRHTGLRGVLGRSVREAVPGLEGFWFDTYGRVASTGEPVRFTHQAAALDGRWFEVYAFRLDDADRHRVAVLFTDITARKRAEEELREQDKRKDEFLATLAHELRNPLAPVRTGLEVMKLAPKDVAAVGKARDMMERQLGHMVRLIDDLLDISRVSRGKVELKTERVDLRAVVETAVETSRPLVDAGRHELTVQLPAEPVWVDADHTRLAQVVSNVLTNAAKYTPDGGRIALTARRDGDAAEVSVTDTGLGIPADMLATVFDLFTQVNRTLDRAQGGLGIGLALVRKLMDMHGGTITADSPGPGRGSTFTVRLPVTAAPPPAADRAERNGRPAAGRRILVVDDNRDGAESLAMFLALSGHAARVAHDGPAALTAAREFDPQVVFLDIGMPGMNGYEVARRFRADERLRGAVLVALTGWGSEDDKSRSREAGFDFHLTKPVEPAAVDGVLSRFSVIG